MVTRSYPGPMCTHVLSFFFWRENLSDLQRLFCSGGWLFSIVEEMAGPIEMDTTFEDAGAVPSTEQK